MTVFVQNGTSHSHGYGEGSPTPRDLIRITRRIIGRDSFKDSYWRKLSKMAEQNYKELQLRRGTGVENAAFTGKMAEPVYLTDTKEVAVHDGSTPGGTILQNKLTFDSTPTTNSNNPVTSDGVYDALATKQDKLTFDSTPTANSNNPVTSQGIKAAIDAKDSLPSQTGHAGEYLKTDGETASWSNVESLPAQTGNAGKVLTTDGEKASWEYGSVGHHILEIFMTSRTDPAPINGAYDCNGAWYNKSDFTGENNPYDMLVAGKAHTCTDAEYEDELNQKGSCGKYVVDTANQRFRVPTINNILQPTVLASAIGEICDAGLPNITGSFYDYHHDNFNSSGVFSEKIENDNHGSSSNGNTYRHVEVNFNASRSNPIYGNSTTVQPQTIKVRPMVQLATAGQEISIEQYEQQLSEYARTNTLNGRLIGEIIQSALPLTDAGVHLLDGSQIQKSGIYAQFCTYVANLQADYPDLFCTEAEFTASVEAYGSCGKFVNGASYIRLPKVSDILQGTTDVTAVGDLIEAGLPNIKGEARASRWINDEQIPSATGAFQWKDGYSNLGGAQNVTNNTRAFAFDASRSSPIYGKSTTVQPQTIKALLYICVATSVKTQIQVDIDNIATDLNSKANRDLSNVTGNAVERVVESSTDYVRYESGLQICWGKSNYQSDAIITYPKPFADLPGVSVGTDGRTATEWGVTNFKLSGSDGYCAWIAIGRWTDTQGITTETVNVTPKISAQTITPSDGYNYISQVNVAAIPYTETDNSSGGKTVSIADFSEVP